MPRGAPLLLGCGASGVRRSPTPDQPSLGRAAGARHPLAVGAGNVGVGTRQPPHSACSSELALRAVGTSRGRWGGGRLLTGCGASGLGRSPTPDRPSLGHAAEACYPLAVGAGGVGVGNRHRPRSARSCKLALRVLGAARGRLRGGLPAFVSGVRGRALSHAQPPAPGACGRGPSSTGCCWEGRGRGEPSQIPQRGCCKVAFRALKAARRRARGGAALAWVWGVRGWAHSYAHRPVLGACGRGPLPTGCGWGGCGRGDPSPTHSARSCELALRVVGAARGRPRGALLALVRGVPGWALSHAQPPAPGACGWGPSPTGCGCAEMWAW